jgi:serine/threonine-protein kinase HipA
MSADPGALEVWLDGQVVADLTMNRRRVPQLRYRGRYVAEQGIGALGLSVPLPVASRPFRGDIVDYWIENLLPEGETRTVLERYFGVRRGDGFALLAVIGRDCAGAVAVMPPGQSLDQLSGALLPLTPAEVNEAIASLRQHPLGVDDDVRVSLGGLQSKLLLVQVDGGWARPVGGLPSTHILKPDPPEFPGLAASEAFAQKAAELAGLSAAEARLDVCGGRTVLVVTRFDRGVTSGKLTRRHQEDGCQALGIDPSGAGKYQAPGNGASYRRLAAVLTAYASDQAGELRRLGSMLAFTVAVGNTDAHLRNHAFLHGAGKLALAPIYDAAPTVAFASTRQLALWVDEQPLLAAVTRGHMIREMVSWGLDRDEAAVVVTDTLTRLAHAYNEAAQAVPEAATSVIDHCKRRTETFLQQQS